MILPDGPSECPSPATRLLVCLLSVLALVLLSSLSFFFNGERVEQEVELVVGKKWRTLAEGKLVGGSGPEWPSRRGRRREWRVCGGAVWFVPFCPRRPAGNDVLDGISREGLFSGLFPA